MSKNSPNRHIAKKRFGQNFLVDEAVISNIFNCLNVTSSDNVLEIGPGLGALTNRLVNLCKNLFVVEIDKDIIPKLKNKFDNLSNFTLFNQDILEFSLDENIFKLLKTDEKLKVVGNIPYNISTPIIFKFIEQIDKISDINFMVQEEVADRLTSPPGSRNYGRLSVMTQYFCRIEKLIVVDASSFSPKPKVSSAFIKFTPHSVLPNKAKNFNTFGKIVGLAFNQRRKTIGKIFKDIISKEALTQLNIDVSVRPENLTIAEFVKISDNCRLN